MSTLLDVRTNNLVMVHIEEPDRDALFLD
jgi:hypothetical protein